jgi:hypothetical protein
MPLCLSIASVTPQYCTERFVDSSQIMHHQEKKEICANRKVVNIYNSEMESSKTNQPCINIPSKIIQQLSTSSPTPSIMF